MTLRKLFAMAGNTDLYIITHSLGACVGTRLLFNSTDGRRFAYKKQWKMLATPPQSRITLAMLAPAIPGKRIFKSIDKTVPAKKDSNYRNLVVGYNKYDVATTKKMRFPLSRLFFSTALGCDPWAVKRAGIIIKKKSPTTVFEGVDISRNGDGQKNRIHHIDKYINDGDNFNRFLKAVFNP